MMYDAEDKYADNIRLPLLAFFKKCENRHQKKHEKCVNKLTTHYKTTRKEAGATTRNRNEQIGGHKA